jgi:hypothetical protein
LGLAVSENGSPVEVELLALPPSWNVCPFTEVLAPSVKLVFAAVPALTVTEKVAVEFDPLVTTIEVPPL